MSPLRAILDTNVVLAAHRSSHAASPNRETVLRWRQGEYTLCFTEDILIEYAEKLDAHDTITDEETIAFLKDVRMMGERIPIAHFHFRHYPQDADDIAFLLCALNGEASHLVTYDGDLEAVRPHYAGQFSICRPLEFLADLHRAAAGA